MGHKNSGFHNQGVEMDRSDPNMKDPADVLLDAARAIDKLNWLIFAARRVGFPVERYDMGPGKFSYTCAALDLAAKGITWQQICSWKS